MSGRSLPPLYLAAVAVVWAATAAGPAHAADHQVGSASDYYSPAYLRVATGDSVTWEPSILHPLKFDGDPPGTPERTATPYTRTFGTPGVYDFYCTNHGGPDRTGMAGRVVVGDANEPPEAGLTPTAERAYVGDVVGLDARGSRDPEGGPLGYDWDLDGDGTFELIEAGPTQSRSWATPGTYTVGVRARDVSGGADVARRAIRVTERTPGSGDPPAGGGGGAGGQPGGSGPPSSGGLTPPPSGGLTPPDIDRVFPELTIAALRGSLRGVAGNGVTVRMTVSELVDVEVATVIKVGSRRVTLKPYSRVRGPGRLTIKIKPTRDLRLLVRRARRARLTVTVRVQDAAGNLVEQRRSLTLV